MKRKRLMNNVALLSLIAGAAALLPMGVNAKDAPGSTAKPAAPASKALIQRGQYLVTVSGCNDCHTPMKMGATGPEPDMARMLSGHPESLAMPSAPKLPPGPWIASVGATMTAWSGPWGTSYTANLTPDRETGLGQWTLENFVETMRTGKHMGRGRPLLPPMPYQNAAQLTPADSAAVFAYLQSIPPVKNRVPLPLPPMVTASR